VRLQGIVCIGQFHLSERVGGGHDGGSSDHWVYHGVWALFRKSVRARKLPAVNGAVRRMNCLRSIVPLSPNGPQDRCHGSLVLLYGPWAGG
jgi:hypothetical protein